MTFKYVVPQIEKEAKRLSKNNAVIIDVPLLFESGLNKICDKTIGVITKKEDCIKRITIRDGINEEKALARISNQHVESFFKEKCDYIIMNIDTENATKQIQEIFDGKNLSNKAVVQITDGDISYLEFRKFLKYEDKIKHAYTLKPLDFGCNANYKANRKEFENNYKKICDSLDLDYKMIYRPYQTHTKVVKKVENEKPGVFTKDFKDVDGLVTNKKNKILSLSFADCIALYFYDPVKNVIGNIHSGWQGTYKEIAKEAIRELKINYNCDPKDLICCIAPSIRKCCFEVDEDVKDMFYEKFKGLDKIDKIIKKGKEKGKYYIDTVLINQIILEKEGLKKENIIDSGICTKCTNYKLHSYRSEGDKSGRNTSIIGLI